LWNIAYYFIKHILRLWTDNPVSMMKFAIFNCNIGFFFFKINSISTSSKFRFVKGGLMSLSENYSIVNVCGNAFNNTTKPKFFMMLLLVHLSTIIATSLLITTSLIFLYWKEEFRFEFPKCFPHNIWKYQSRYSGLAFFLLDYLYLQISFFVISCDMFFLLMFFHRLL
jgi:hypothetical protein